MTTTKLPYREIRRNDEPVMWRPVINEYFIDIDGKPFLLRQGKDVEIINLRTGQHYRNDPRDFTQNWVLPDEDRALFERYYPGVLDGEGE